LKGNRSLWDTPAYKKQKRPIEQNTGLSNKRGKRRGQAKCAGGKRTHEKGGKFGTKGKDEEQRLLKGRGNEKGERSKETKDNND